MGFTRKGVFEFHRKDHENRIMCGILGSISANTNVVQFERALKTMAHRGPDGYGIEVFPQKSTGKTVFLGHQRLSIIDLTASAHQPMKYQNWTIVYNGEVLNYKELRSGLEAKGYSFFSNSDTEVVLKSFIEKGPECVHAFRGMWAFAIWNESTKMLFLSRDRFGIKPMFYYTNGEEFAFASEIKALLSLDFVPKSPAIEDMKSFLVWGPPEYKPETLFSGINKLMPSHNLLVEIKSNGALSEIKIKQYYSIKEKVTSKNLLIPFLRAIEQYRDYHRKAVDYSLVSDVPIGCALSGGLDSSSNVLVINSLLKEKRIPNIGEKQITFSAVYKDQPNCSCDESVYINQLSDFLTVINKQVEPTSDRYFNEIEKFIWHQEEPTGGASVFAGWCVAQLTAQFGIRVSLDGQGADEYLGGYNAFIGAYLAQNSLSPWKNWPFFFSKHNNLGFAKAVKYHFSHLFSKASKNHFFTRLKRQFGLNRKLFEERMFFTEYKNVDDASFDFLINGLPTLLKFGDRNYMAHSIESRPPFLDHELVEFCLSVPNEFILRKGWTKYIARKAFENDLPSEIVWRRDKMGFPAPEERWVLEKNLFLEEAVKKSKIFREINPLQTPWETFSTNTRLRLFEIAIWEKVFRL